MQNNASIPKTIPLVFDPSFGYCQEYPEKVKALHANRKPTKFDEVKKLYLEKDVSNTN